MSTGKRLAKRSIIGTRVAALVDDGLYYSGMIQAVKTPAPFPENNNCINLTPNTRYTVRFDGGKMTREYRDAELIGPGFRGMAGVKLQPGQRVFLTYNGREVRADILHHDHDTDDLRVQVHAPGTEAPIDLKKRLDEVRLLESRKSARLADVDTDFARLADMAGDRRRASATIEVPAHITQHVGSRKRGPSSSCDLGYGEPNDQMNECNAALVLMSLSCSPNSPRPSASWGGRSSVSPGASSSSGSSWRSGTPSPPPASSSFSDEGIAMDYEDMHPRKKKINSIVYECTWRGCGLVTTTCASIEAHIRNTHLGPKKEGESDHEEEFYYTEREVSVPAPPPTLSHQDMCRPPYEDPDYQRQLVGSFRQGLLSTMQNNTARPISIPVTHSWSSSHSPKHMRLTTGGSPSSPGRRPRSDNKKCRKVYGMDQRELWCTQCKWKKACTRFGD
ncbi:hypothetical protein O0L34_g12379 [Tuta absoluta]|nr:hypothetical protein O0L34_g12379 [Tuta absoluta]